LNQIKQIIKKYKIKPIKNKPINTFKEYKEEIKQLLASFFLSTEYLEQKPSIKEIYDIILTNPTIIKEEINKIKTKTNKKTKLIELLQILSRLKKQNLKEKYNTSHVSMLYLDIINSKNN